MGNKGAFITIKGDDLKPNFTSFSAVQHPPVKVLKFNICSNFFFKFDDVLKLLFSTLFYFLFLGKADGVFKQSFRVVTWFCMSFRDLSDPLKLYVLVIVRFAHVLERQPLVVAFFVSFNVRVVLYSFSSKVF